MADAEALQSVMTKVREAAQVGTWNQREWGSSTQGCGTAYCFAGWFVVMDGGKLTGANTFVLSDGFQLHGAEIGRYVATRLRLTEEEANELFMMDNTLEDLELMVEELCAA